MTKTKKVKKTIKKNILDENEIKEGVKIDTQKDLDLTDNEIIDDEEKTGWWS